MPTASPKCNLLNSGDSWTRCRERSPPLTSLFSPMRITAQVSRRSNWSKTSLGKKPDRRRMKVLNSLIDFFEKRRPRHYTTEWHDRWICALLQRALEERKNLIVEIHPRS